MASNARRAANSASVYQTLPARILIILLTVGLALIALSSLDWPMRGDLPANLYVARLMGRHGYVPYRDFWSDSLPGAFLMYMAVGELGGYTNAFGLRLVDLLYLALLSAVTFRWLRKVGAEAAWAAPVIFGLLYLASDSPVILGPDALLILPIACAILLATSLPRLDDRLRAFLIGLMFGLALTVRLQSIIGLLVVALFAALEIRARSGDHLPPVRRLAALTLYALGGVALPAVVLALYLITNNALSPFIEIVSNYWPLATGLTDAQAFVADAEVASYRLNWFTAFDGLIMWLAPAGVGLLAAFYPDALSSRQKRLAALIGGMLVSYGLYALIGGSFQHHNWIIFVYFLAALSALCFLRLPRDASLVLRWLPLVVLALAFASRPNTLRGYADQIAQLVTGAPPPPGDERADAITAYLRENFQPGDTVQALDSGGPAVQAMLIADALPANRHVYGIRFYHDVQTPYIQGQREELVTALAQHPPRYVVEVSGYPSITGENTTTEFLELQLLMAADYELVAADGTYGIYERVNWATLPNRALVAYGLDEGQTADWFPSTTSLAVTPIPIGALPPDEVTGQLRRTLPQDVLVSFVYFDETADRGLWLDGWALTHLYRLGQRWSQRARAVDLLNGDQSCAAAFHLGVLFGETGNILLRAEEPTLINIDSSRIVCVRLWWLSSDDMSAYSMAVHIINEDGASIAQYDVPINSGIGTANEPGYIHKVAILLPADAPLGNYSVQVIAYDPVTGRRLPLIDFPGQPDYLTIGGFTLTP